MRLNKNINRKKRGAALVEYGLLIAGVALVSAVGISLFGKKTNEMISVTAGVLPGANAADDAPIKSTGLIKTTTANGAHEIDFSNIGNGDNTMDNVYGAGAEDLISD
jgi:Flp pilus assembly pilin Flp